MWRKEIYLSQLLIISKIVMDNIVSEDGQNHPKFESNESGQNIHLFVMTIYKSGIVKVLSVVQGRNKQGD